MVLDTYVIVTNSGNVENARTFVNNCKNKIKNKNKIVKIKVKNKM